MYIKLLVAIISLVLIPIVIALRNEYITGFGFYNTGFSPEVWGYGRLLAAGIFIFCIICVLIGLLIPRAVIFLGTKTRKHVLIIYISIALTSIFIFFLEVPYLTDIQRNYETENIRKIFKTIEPGMTQSEIEKLAQNNSKYIRSFTKEKEGAIQIGYPSTFSILVERNTGILLKPYNYDESNCLDRELVLLVDGEIIETKVSIDN